MNPDIQDKENSTQPSTQSYLSALSQPRTRKRKHHPVPRSPPLSTAETGESKNTGEEEEDSTPPRQPKRYGFQWLSSQPSQAYFMEITYHEEGNDVINKCLLDVPLAIATHYLSKPVYDWIIQRSMAYGYSEEEKAPVGFIYDLFHVYNTQPFYHPRTSAEFELPCERGIVFGSHELRVHTVGEVGESEE